MSLRDLISPVLVSDPDRVAVIGPNRRLSYRQLDDRATALASHWLTSDLKPHDRVAFWCVTAPVLISYLACWKAGLIPVPLDLRYQTPQTRCLE